MNNESTDSYIVESSMEQSLLASMDKFDFALVDDTLQTSKEEMRNSLQKCFEQLKNMRE